MNHWTLENKYKYAKQAQSIAIFEQDGKRNESQQLHFKRQIYIKDL